jgi:hypothetical protein
MYFAAPTASFGYYRGAPQMGGGAQSGGGQGVNMAGTNVFSQGQGPTNSSAGSGWNPTILYLFGLIIAEMVIFGVIARKL